MATCPNCQRDLLLESKKCESCGAVFDSPDSWKPLPETAAEKAQAMERPSSLPLNLSRPNKLSLITAFAALSLYVIALFEPALLFERLEPLPGYHILFWGWWGVLAGSVAWYANIFLFLAERYYLKGYSGRALLLGALALGLGLTSSLATEWWFSEAAGTKISGLGSGYRYWLYSMALFLVASLISVFRKSPDGQKPQGDLPT